MPAASHAISTHHATPQQRESTSTQGNLVLVAMMPISFALIVLLIVFTQLSG